MACILILETMNANFSRNLDWKEVSPGRWERDLDEAEQFYTSLVNTYGGSGRTFFAMTGHLSLSVAVPEDTSHQTMEQRVIKVLQRVWLALRYDHPTIASWVEYDHSQKKCRKVYETLPGRELEIERNNWLNTTFSIISDARPGHEWCSDAPPVPLLLTIFLLKTPSSNINGRVLNLELVLRSHHDIIDGIGTLHLFNNLLSHTASTFSQGSSSKLPTFGSEWTNLSPLLRIAANIAYHLTQDQTTRYEQIIAHSASLHQHAKINSVPFQRGPTLPGKRQRVARTLSPNHSSLALLQACRTQGITVTHAYHAATAMCMRDRQPRGPTTTPARTARYIINYRPANPRAHRTPPLDAPAVHPSPCSGRRLAVAARPADGADRRDEFGDVARRVRGLCVAVRNGPGRLPPAAPLCWALETLPWPEEGGGAGGVPLSVSISRVGVVDRVVFSTPGPVELGDPWAMGEELGSGLELCLGTWRGELSLSAAYNDAWLEKGDVLKFLQDCEDTVFNGLGV